MNHTLSNDNDKYNQVKYSKQFKSSPELIKSNSENQTSNKEDKSKHISFIHNNEEQKISNESNLNNVNDLVSFLSTNMDKINDKEMKNKIITMLSSLESGTIED